MKAICNETDLTDLVGYGYSVEYVPQYGNSVTTLDGADHSAKIRDRVRLTVPFIALTDEQLADVLALFPETNAYVTWTYDDPKRGADRTVQMKYEVRQSKILAGYRDGSRYWNGLTLTLTER